jgi:hypothetical protein
MSSLSTRTHHRAARTFSTRTVLILLGATVGAIAVNAVVAGIAVRTGASSSFPPLTPPVYAAFTVLGVIVGWIGWRIVLRRFTRARRVLMLLVPVVTLASFTPDLVLLITKFIPGTDLTAVVALMTMHVVVVAFAVPGYALATARPTGAN